MFWKILKIEPTADRSVIRTAYRELLSVTNPEDSPEEFKALREAYEQALAYADEHAEDKVQTPAEKWQDDLAALYDDFARRNDLSEWQKLLNQDVCLSVDSRMECEDILLRFLMEHYFLSHEVWVYFDEQFSWLERQEELYETYPADFIDYVIVNGIHFNDILPMKLFAPGTDGEEAHRYLSLYLKAQNAENETVREEALTELMTVSEQHPYGTAVMLNRRILRGEEDALKELYDLHRSYPGNMFLGQMLADTLFDLKQIPECLEVLEEMKKIDARNYRLRWLEAFCLAEQDRHQDAVKIIDAMLRDSAGDGQMQYELDQKRIEWNHIIIEKLEKELAENPDDIEAKVNLAWAYLENNHNEKAEALVSALPEDYEDRFGYYNLTSSIAMAMEKYDKAAGLLEKLAEVTENLPADTEQNITRRGRLGEVLIRLGYCLHALKQNEEAEAVYERALQCATNRTEVLTHIADTALSDRNYEKTLEYSRQLIREFPAGYRGYLLMAYAYFYTHHDREAYNAVERALELCRSDLAVYTLKARILIHNDMAENAKEIIDFLKESGLQDDPSVLFTEGVYREDCENNPAGAGELYEKAAEALGSNYTYAEFGAELFYRLLCIRGNELDAYEEEERNQLMELADKGLECNPDYYGLLDYKAWLLARAGAYDEARAMYLELQKNPHHGPSVEAELGYICYQDLEHSADKALEYYEQSLAAGGSISGHFYAGMCLMYMHRLKEAEEHFARLKELNPKSADGPFRLSIAYAMDNQPEKALQEAEEAIERVRDREGDQSVYYIRKATILRRLQRYDEAIAVIRETMERYGYPYGNRLIFQIYAHAGRLKEAECHLKQWAEKNSTDSELCDCGILLHLYRKDFEGAMLENKMVSGYLHPDRALEVDHIIAECFGDYKQQLKHLLKWLQYRLDRDGFDISRIEGAVAMCCFRLGDFEQARVHAENALQEVDRKLAEFETDKLLFMARRIRLLALLGRKEETEEAIEACRKLPFCQSCPEHTCKDMDIFRMEAEEIFGNYEKAYEIALECQSLYPDEEDFLIAERNLKKKVK